MTIHVLHNVCYGGFGFSEEFKHFLTEKGYEIKNIHDDFKIRTDSTLIAYVEAYGIERAAAKYAKLRISAVPEFYDWRIDEYDGYEAVIVEFPWEQLARALLNNDESNPILKAVREGRLVIPN
jgi:hypothetical protein